MAGHEPSALRRQRGLVAAAAVHHVRRARLKAAARRRSERARDLTAQDGLLAALARIERQRRREQRLGVRMLRRERHLGGRTELDEVALSPKHPYTQARA